MEIILNKEKVDYRDDYKTALKDLIQLQSKHFPFQSVDVMKENMINLMSDFRIIFNHEKQKIKKIKKKTDEEKEVNKTLTFLLKKVESFMASVEWRRTRESMIRMIYDFLLGLEGVGYLNGFGFGNKFGDHILGNAERQSYSGYFNLVKQ